MISVIIPAHNEASVIGRCLSKLTDGLEPGEAEIIVVCNGCTDNTAEIARAYKVKVIETPARSKVKALNIGDQAASWFPRFYVDADVCLPAASLRMLSEAILQKGFELVLPQAHVYVDDSPSWAVRWFYEIWQRLPCCSLGLIGGGAYGLSTEGRRRFREFPNIISDDGFVRLHFRPEEQHVIKDAKVYVYPPRSVKGLVRAHSRIHRGNWQLKRQFPYLWQENKESNLLGLMKTCATPRVWPHLTVYVAVKLLARVQAALEYSRDADDSWASDDSREYSGL